MKIDKPSKMLPSSMIGEAVLRRLTRNWLTQHPQVLAFCAAPPQAGGDGAVVILLKISPGENEPS